MFDELFDDRNGCPDDDSDVELSERLARRAWRIANLVMHSDLAWIDIEIEINAMRQLVEDEQPEHLELFEHLFVARFHRLREQWGPDVACA